MLSTQGPVQDPSALPVLIVGLAIALVLWWRTAFKIVIIALVIMLGLGAVAVFHDMHPTVVNHVAP